MKILVTGANGYLGRGITNKLLNAGIDVVATDISVSRVDTRAKRIAVNIFDVESPFEYFGKPDAVLHLAWHDGFVHYSESHLGDLSKHYNFLKSLIDSGIRKVAVMGSMHEIGFFEGSVNEETPCWPISLYGISKNALREAVQPLAKSKSVEFQWLRGYYIVGNTSLGSSIFSKIIGAAKDGKTEFPFTQGQNQYDFVDYDDFCYYVALTVQQNKVNGIINISSGKPEKLADRVERFIVENELNITLKYGAFPDRPYDSKAIWGDNSKLIEILNACKKS